MLLLRVDRLGLVIAADWPAPQRHRPSGSNTKPKPGQNGAATFASGLSSNEDGPAGVDTNNRSLCVFDLTDIQRLAFPHVWH